MLERAVFMCKFHVPFYLGVKRCYLQVLERAVFMCKFHRGLDTSTLTDRFNYTVQEQMRSHFGQENHASWDLSLCPVPVRLTRVKTGFAHVGFLESDAVRAVQKYMDVAAKRGQDMAGPLFLTSRGAPVNSAWVKTHFARLAERSGVQKAGGVNATGRRINRVRSHELRDLLKSTLIESGCRTDVADHVIGHSPGDSYEKQAILYPRTMGTEYAKAATRLNIFTRLAASVSGNDGNAELQKRLEQWDAKMAELERRVDGMAAALMRGSGAAPAMRQAGIGEALQVRSRSADWDAARSPAAAERLEFSCMECGLVHPRSECPACGSTHRRLFEP